MQNISEKVMTDEETDCDDGQALLVRRVPPWRSEKLTKLMRTLDNRKNTKSDVAPKKERQTGPLSDRSPPKDIPKWALQDPQSHPFSDTSSSAVEFNSSTNSPVPSPTEILAQSVQTSTPVQPQTTQSQPSTPTVLQQALQVCATTPLSRHSRASIRSASSSPAHDSSSIKTAILSDSEHESCDDELSLWIRAVTGLK